MAATNRPEILDPAVLRPGRFDRQVLVDHPDKRGRADILRIYLDRVQTDGDIDVERVAAMTAGMVGADLANVVNEAALLAVRQDKAAITLEDITEAVERIVAGLEKKQRLINVIMVTLISNIGKMFPAFCYRDEAHWHYRLAVAVGMWPRGEVGAGVLVLSLSYGIGGPVVTVAMLSLTVNLILTGVFILMVKKLIDGVPEGLMQAA